MPRTGWLRTIERPESVDSHMYRLSFLVRFSPEGVDKDRCVFIALCHDIAETVAGDIPTYAGVSKDEKYKLEELGILYIESLLQNANPNLGADIRAAWLEYEKCQTAESRWVREMDKLECMIQACEYEKTTYGEKNLEEFQGLASKIHSVEGKAILYLLQQERAAHFEKRRRRTPVIFIIGTPGVDMKTRYNPHLLSQEFGFQHISLNNLLLEKSEDQSYLHAKVVKAYLDAKVNVPTQLAISLLEEKINEGISEGKSWTLASGFPETIEQLDEFKKQVQKTNYTLFLNCSSEETLGQSLGRGGDELDVVNRLKEEDGYFKEIHSDGPVEEVFPLVKKAVEECIQHAEGSVQHAQF